MGNISGYVGVSGATITLSSGGSTTSDSTGFYTIASAASGVAVVTPSASNFVFSPSSQSVLNPGQVPPNPVNFTATFVLSGNVSKSGASQPGVIVICTAGNGTVREAIADSGGNYSFNLGTTEQSWVLSAPSVNSLKTVLVQLNVAEISALPAATFGNANLIL